jgi:hypothetical protein
VGSLLARNELEGAGALTHGNEELSTPIAELSTGNGCGHVEGLGANA